MDDLTKRVEDFLNPGDGYGCGDGFGSGSGYGFGYGFGYGSGSGSGSGYGDGDGSGSGDGDGSGYGYGFGYGFGSGSGYGFGYGFGDGDGYGDGYGSGDGDGYGSGDGIKSYCGSRVYLIDDVATLIDRVRGTVAKGRVLRSDLITEVCFIVKQDGKFAHGESLRDAMDALREKLFDDTPEEERIAAFRREHRLGVRYPCMDLFHWHHILTGSCEMGRKEFAKDHEINLDTDAMTVEEFIRLTRNSYGGDVIRRLEAAYQTE